MAPTIRRSGCRPKGKRDPGCHDGEQERPGHGNALQRGHGRGPSPSKPSIRVRSSHSPHHGGLDRSPGGIGSSAGESRAVSTAYGFRRPPVSEPVKAASSRGAQPTSSAASTAGRILPRCAAVSGQTSPRPSKNSPTGPPTNPRSRYGMSKRPLRTPTRGPRCVMTGPGPHSTGMPLTWSPPTSRGPPGSRQGSQEPPARPGSPGGRPQAARPVRRS
jgi:hypothetical protein